jgi:hypothetical protein
MVRRPVRALLVVLPGLVCCCLVVGCGKSTYNISGKVTFKGQPIPAGTIYFIPDTKKGNEGPSGWATIKDGSYDTSAEGGKGMIGGPMIVAIEGIDTTAGAKTDKSGVEIHGKALFPKYEMSVDLPKEKTTKDFDVPADAAKSKKGNLPP